jgi:AcrR family transcriptional regulator
MLHIPAAYHEARFTFPQVNRAPAPISDDATATTVNYASGMATADRSGGAMPDAPLRPMTDARPQRADAIRNRTKILKAARELITLRGPDVPMEAIAQAAEVAVGTLYRHYPTKTALVGAVLAEHAERIADDVDTACARVAKGARAIDELKALVARTLEAAAQDHAVKAAAQRFGATDYMQDHEERGKAAMSRLIAAAQADGDMNPDVTADDFLLLLATAPLDQPPEILHRWLTLILRGFTTP